MLGDTTEVLNGVLKAIDDSILPCLSKSYPFVITAYDMAIADALLT